VGEAAEDSAPDGGSGEVVLHLWRQSLAVLDALLDGGGSVVVTGGCGGSHTTDPVSDENHSVSHAPFCGARVPVG
jgi:hypothetical protein